MILAPPTASVNPLSTDDEDYDENSPLVADPVGGSVIDDPIGVPGTARRQPDPKKKQPPSYPCPLCGTSGRNTEFGYEAFQSNDLVRHLDSPWHDQALQTWRMQALRRSSRSCEQCGAKQPLQVHHKVPIRIAPHLIIDPQNAVVLCEPCHRAINHHKLKPPAQPGTLPTTLGELAILLLCLREREIPRSRIASKLDISIRSCAYHLATLKERGLLQAEHHFQLRSKPAWPGQRQQYPNTYSTGIHFASLSSSVLLKRLKRQYYEISRSGNAQVRDAKVKAHLMSQVLILLEELARTWGVLVERLLVETHRYLRQFGTSLRSYIRVLVDLKRYLSRHFFRHTVRDPVGVVCYALSPSLEDPDCLNMWWELSLSHDLETLAGRKAYYLGVRS